MEDKGSQHISAKLREFPPELILRITNNFCKDQIIGHGGYGVVYKGVLDDGVEIAVKKLYSSQPGPHDDFNNEVMILKGVRHQNIVQLIGSCYVKRNTVIEYNGEHIPVREDERLLCLEYLKGGNLQKLLSDESRGLDWEARYKIIKGTCEGLKYLQTGCKDPIYHLDLKPENILLDDDMIPKIGDFGLSRLLDSKKTHTTKTFKGTCGYMPPEYINGQRISLKSDIFSLGVVIIKVIAGEEGYYECDDIPAQEFINFAKMSSDTSEEIKTCTKIGLRCVEKDRAKRPNISEIVDELNQIDAAKSSFTGQSTEEKEHTTLGKQPEIQEEKNTNTEHSGAGGVKKRIDSRYAITDRISTRVKHHTQSVDVATGAMGSLLPKLTGLLKDEYDLQKDVKSSIKSLYSELEGMQAALRSVAKLRLEQLDGHGLIMTWARDVRDLSYDSEDFIDSLLVTIQLTEPDTNQEGGVDGGSIPRSVEQLLERAKACHKSADTINGISKMPRYSPGLFQRYKVDYHILGNANAASTSGTPLLAQYQYPKNMVGIDHSMDDVIWRLEHGTGGKSEQDLKIVCIVGTRGVGKTTLAKAVYDSIQARYDINAFVSLSRNSSTKKVLMDILIAIDKQTYMNASTLDEGELIDELQELLASKRYLIAIDDIWDTKSWEMIQKVLINMKNKSRVVTTTRISEVAEKADEVYNLKALSDESSKVLFNTRLFGGKAYVPVVLQDVSAKLLEKCDGLPLAIITMAGLLTRKPWEDWPKVYKSSYSGYGHGQNEDIERSILLFSYYDLPVYLRACLLHLNIFPEDCSIQKDTLIWKWVAEGFVCEEPGIGLFEAGERYFSELINRSLIVPVEDSRRHIITGCRLHGLVLDMIRTLSAKVNFVTILDDSEQPEYTPMQGIDRRLAVQKSASDQGDPLANRSTKQLRSFNAIEYEFKTKLSLESFGVLRVLALEKCTFMKGRPYHLEHLGRLPHLRYLGLHNTPIRKLPGEVGDLILLQTLDLRGTRVNKLPRTIGRLRQLKCLRADDTTIVPDWIGNLASLEVLQLDNVSDTTNFAEELGKLTELRELEIWIDGCDENSNRALVESLSNLHKIRVLRLMSGVPGEEANLEGYLPPRQLRELRLEIASFRLPAWINPSLVPNLSHLFVAVKAVEEHDLDILGNLPELISMELLMPMNIFPSIKGGGAFPKLRCFDTSVPFRFLPGAMLSLESFYFKVDVRALKNANFDFDFSTLGNLPLLQKAGVEIRSWRNMTRYSEMARAAVVRAIKDHPNGPNLLFFEM